MSDTAKELGANDSTITVMEEVWEFEQKLKKVAIYIYEFSLYLWTIKAVIINVKYISIRLYLS